MKYDLSILIPARNEMFLARTVQDLLENIEGKTEIIVVLDGAPADPELPQDERLTVIYHPESVGQRAATNEAARLSEAKYVMKVDAHCAFDKGFDVKLLAKMQDDYTMVPIMRNLHAFDWVCPDGHRRYQGPSGDCQTCGKPTERDVVWIAKQSPQSTSYRFDNTLHFQYFNEWTKTETYREQKKTGLTETMSLQGSAFLLTREKYWELNICDEATGSWGQQGVEVAMKTWLSGGRVVCNHDTWYAHMFRTQGGDFGFPYPNPGVEQARNYSRDVWLNNKFEKQIYPLSWVIDKFSPLPTWEGDDLFNVRLSGTVFLATHPLTNTTDTFGSPCSIDYMTIRQGMPSSTSVSSSPSHILGVSNRGKVEWVTAPPIVTHVVKFHPLGNTTDKPLICEAVYADSLAVSTATARSGVNEESTIPTVVELPNPVPATGSGIDFNTLDKPREGMDVHGSMIPQNTVSKGAIFYTDNRLDEKMNVNVQHNIAVGMKGSRIVSISLKPMDFGDNIHLPLERGYLTMFKQILAGLEELDTDIVFFTEHDVLYHPSHFNFIPPRKDVFYYNTNVWKLRLEDGMAVRTDDCRQLSGLCCYRELALEHYRKRVKIVEEKGFSRKMGFEPGTHRRAERVDDYTSDTWESAEPNVDLRHDKTLTPSRWSPDQFRNKVYTKGWRESYEIPGWDVKQIMEGVT